MPFAIDSSTKKKLFALGWTPGIAQSILRVVGLKPTKYEENMIRICSLISPSDTDGRDKERIPGCDCHQCFQAVMEGPKSFIPAYGPPGSRGYWSPIPGCVCTRESFTPQRFFFHVLKWKDPMKVRAFFCGSRYSVRLDKKKVARAIVAQRLYADAPDGAEHRKLRRQLLNESVRLAMACSPDGYGEIQQASIARWEAERKAARLANNAEARRHADKVRATIACSTPL
jgi:hypothetical protein